MGTFIIRPTSRVSGGVVQEAGSYMWTASIGADGSSVSQLAALQATDGNILFFGQFGDGGVANTLYPDIIRFGFGGNSIYLDGSSSPISVNNLQKGFTPTIAVLYCTPASGIAITGNWTATFNLQLKSGTNGVQNNINFSYGPVPSMFSIISNGCGIYVAIQTGTAGSGTIAFDELAIEGTYNVTPPPQTSWDINGIPSTSSPPTIPTIPTNYNNIITITPGINTPINLTQLNPVTVQYTDIFNNPQVITISTNYPTGTTPYLIAWTPYVYSFYVPILINVNPADPITIVATGPFIDINGNPFTGSVPLGTLTISIVNGAGIYVISPGKTADTMYINTPVSNATMDVKIIDPFIKTSFLP
jgi:hypothetical protein